MFSDRIPYQLCMRYSKVNHLFSLIDASPIQPVYSDEYNYNGVSLEIKRDDLIHPILSGNKWRKLKYLLLAIEAKGYRKIASMGGRYSNFLHSLAYICNLLDWECEFFVRGYEQQALTPTLTDCLNWGAKISFVDRNHYRELREIKTHSPSDCFWIPEGGLDRSSILGLKEVFMDLTQDYDYLVMASATGTSIAGLSLAAFQLKLDTKIVGISVLDNYSAQIENINYLTNSVCQNWDLISGYEFSGFAKSCDELDCFISDYYKEYHIPLEPVYSGKSFYAVNQLIRNNYFKTNSKILLLHCGGLQGKR